MDEEDIEVRLAAKEGWAAAQGRQCVVVLATELTEELAQEGLARDVVRVVQDRRKEMGCEYTDRIRVGVVTKSTTLGAAVDAHSEYIKNETLTETLKLAPLDGVEGLDTTVSGHAIVLFAQVCT